MTLNPTGTLAVCFAVLLIGAAFAPLGVATDAALVPSSPADEPVPAASTPAAIDEALATEDGETELFLLLPDVPNVDRRGGPDAVVDALQTQAARTQAPVVSELERLDAVTVEDRFWIRNSVIVTADLDEIDLETLAAVDGVERIEPTAAPDVSEPTSAVASDDSTGATPAPPAGPSSALLTDGESPNDARQDDATWGLELINAPDVWESFGATGDGARVVVAHEGVDPGHPDIDLADEDGWKDFVTDRDEPYDDSGEGTHVSGVVAGGNASGTAIGVAPDAELGVVKMCRRSTKCVPADVLAGFEWVVETDTDVLAVNQYYDMNETYADVVANTMDAGTLVVAADSRGFDDSPLTFSETYDSVVGGAIDENGTVPPDYRGTVVEEAEFGDQWKDHWPSGSYITPDVVAPGFDVYSATSPDGYTCDADYYCVESGLSLSAAHVAGAATVISGVNQELGPWEIREILQNTAWKPDDWDPDDAEYYNPDTGRDSTFGTGVVDLYAAVRAAKDPATIEGTVTGSDGTPIEGVTVTVDGAERTQTGADGTYELDFVEGTYPVRVDAFGYESASQTATLEANGTTTVDFAIDRTPAIDLSEPARETVLGGETISTTLAAANVETLAVDLAGEYDAANATLTIDGTEAAFGDPVAFDEPVTGEIDVTVQTTTDTAGTVTLEHTATGLGDETTLETGPTTVVAEPLSVEIVESNSPVLPGETVVLDVAIENIVDRDGEQSISLADVDGTVVDSTTSDLSVGERTEVTLTWETDASDVGGGEVTVSADGVTRHDVVSVERTAGTIEIDDATVVVGEDVTVEIRTDLENVAGYQVELWYSDLIVEFVEAEGVDIADPVVDVEPGGGSPLRLAASQAEGVDGPTLARLTFSTGGEGGHDSTLSFDEEYTRLNTETEVIHPEVYDEGLVTVVSECAEPGDVDGNGETSSLDATLTQQHIAGFDPEGFERPECADLTDDGEITPADVTAILQEIVGP